MSKKLEDQQRQIKGTEAGPENTPELAASSKGLVTAGSTLADSSQALDDASSTLVDSSKVLDDSSQVLESWNALSEQEKLNFTHNQVFHGLANNTTKCEKDHTCNFGPGMTGDLGGPVPVEGEGLLDGRPWYFRARYNTWSFNWADTADADPIYVNLGYEPGVHYEQPYKVAEPYAAGYMSLDEAFELVCKAREIVRHSHVWEDSTGPQRGSVLKCVCNAQRLRTSEIEARSAKRATHQVGQRATHQTALPLEDAVSTPD